MTSRRRILRPRALVPALGLMLLFSSGFTVAGQGGSSSAAQASELCQSLGDLSPKDGDWGTPNGGGRNCTGLPTTVCLMNQSGL